MKAKGKISERSIVYGILLAVGAIAGVAVFFIVLNLTGGSVPKVELPDLSVPQTSETAAQTTTEGRYDPGSELTNEMMDAATKLLMNNHEVLSLYYTVGLSHKDEPYGNAPEDGYYTVEDSTYTSLDQLEDLVDSTYIKTFAKDVKTNPLGYGAVYKTRDDGSLGIIANFTPMAYDLLWEDPEFVIHPVSETECDIDVTLKKKEDKDKTKTVNAHMEIEGSEWRLTSIVF